jgi:hypothetical protein
LSLRGLLPTPRASERENRQTKRTPSQEAGAHGLCLAAEVLELLPTPRVSGDSDIMSPPPSTLTGSHGLDLGPAVGSLLPTPRATDGTKGGPNQRGSSGDLMLPSAVVSLLPTPSATDSHGHYNRSGGRSGEMLLPGIVRELSAATKQPSDSTSAPSGD